MSFRKIFKKSNKQKKILLKRNLFFVFIICFLGILISFKALNKATTKRIGSNFVKPAQAQVGGMRGVNIHNLAAYEPGTISSILNGLGNNCQNLVRFWGFQHRGGENQGLANIGKVLNNAPAGMKFIVALEDFYDIPGWSDNPAPWFENGYQERYRQYVTDVLDSYGTNDKVLVWEIMNEPHCNRRPGCYQDFKNFVEDISQIINDRTNGYVSPGLMGAHLTWPQYEEISNLGNITANSCHYNANTNSPSTCQTARERSSAGVSFFYIGEAGRRACQDGACNSTCPEDDLLYRSHCLTIEADQLLGSGANAFLAWQHSPPYYDCDEFSLFPYDPYCSGVSREPPDLSWCQAGSGTPPEFFFPPGGSVTGEYTLDWPANPTHFYVPEEENEDIIAIVENLLGQIPIPIIGPSPNPGWTPDPYPDPIPEIPEDLIRSAQLASQATGIRASLILAVISNESSFRQFPGTGLYCDQLCSDWVLDACQDCQPPPDQGEGSCPQRGNEYCQYRDSDQCSSFDQIWGEIGSLYLGLYTKTTIPFSPAGIYCASDECLSHCGGAMGPAQGMPVTWLDFKGRVRAIIGPDPSPWEYRDAFVFSGLHLRDRYRVSTSCSASAGASSQTCFAEACSVQAYMGGHREHAYTIVGLADSIAQELSGQYSDPAGDLYFNEDVCQAWIE